KPRDPQEYRQALDDIAEETDHLIALTEDLLSLARRDGKTGSNSDLVNLSALLVDVSDSLRPLMEARGLDLKREIQEGLSVRGDGDDLIRLFVNLLDNSIKFTEHGEIRISAEQRKDGVKISFSDTGVG